MPTRHWIYAKVIRPIFRQNSDRIESFMKKAGDTVEDYSEQVKSVAKEAVIMENDKSE